MAGERFSIKRIIAFTGIIVASCFIGWALLIGVYMLPMDGIEKNMIRSAQIIVEEGYYPAWFEEFAVRMRPGNLGDIRTYLLNNRITARDNYTDSLMLENAAYDGKESVFEKSLIVYRYTVGDEYAPLSVLDEYYLNGIDDELEVAGYARYWHGYLVMLKPLLSVMDIGSIRLLNLLLLAVLTVVLLLRIRKTLGNRIAAIFMYSMIFYMPFTVPFCMQYCTMSYITLVALIALFSGYDAISKRKLWGYYFLLIGISTSYIDYLTYPLVSFGLPLIFLLYMDSENEISLIGMIRYGIDWSVGYVGMWASKWILASTVTNEDVIGEAVKHVVRRSSSLSEDGSFTISLFKAWASNLCNYVNIVYGSVIILTFIVVVKILLGKKNSLVKCLRSDWKYLVVAALPFIWYTVFKNHSYSHGSFTYRLLIISVFGVLMFVERCVYSESERKLTSSQKIHKNY